VKLAGERSQRGGVFKGRQEWNLCPRVAAFVRRPGRGLVRGLARAAPSVLTGWLLCVVVTAVSAQTSHSDSPFRFEVRIKPGLIFSASAGRLFIVLSPTNSPEPRELLGKAGIQAPQAFARDVQDFGSGDVATVDQAAFGFPTGDARLLPAADYFAQALLDRASELRMPNAPGNLYSLPQKVHFDPAQGGVVQLELNQQIPAEQLPPDTRQIRFIKLRSKLLSDFHQKAMFLRAGILLPQNYESEHTRQYPLWIRIGGFNTRCWVLNRLMADDKSGFRQVWQAPGTPRFLLLQLDGAGPYGDPYYVNSANNGPYGDALTQELIPYVEAQFRAIGRPRARVLSGSSTGGWVSLALQIFYPDFFNGTWSSCPDPVDFRAYELVNIYEGTNAYVNNFGNERPSERDLDGDVVLTMRQEVGMENLLGRGNSYVCSGEQWGAWNAAFGPRGSDGRPVPLWDPQSGKINHNVAEAWRKYDLRIVLTENWKALSPRLRGKLHIASGEADQYFLNNAVHLLDEALSQVNPPFTGKIVYGPGKPHGWMDLPLAQMLEEMRAATEGERH